MIGLKLPFSYCILWFKVYFVLSAVTFAFLWCLFVWNTVLSKVVLQNWRDEVIQTKNSWGSSYSCCFFVCHILMALMDTCWFSELDVLGAHPSNGSLKSWGTRCEIQNLHSSELEVGVPSELYGAMLGFMASVSQDFPSHFYVGIFSCAMCTSSTSFWVSFRGNYQCAAVHLVRPWKEGTQ